MISETCKQTISTNSRTTLCWILIVFTFGLSSCETLQALKQPPAKSSAQLMRAQAPPQSSLVISEAEYRAKLVEGEDRQGSADELSLGGVMTVKASYLIRSRTSQWVRGTKRNLSIEFPRALKDAPKISGDCQLDQKQLEHDERGEGAVPIKMKCLADEQGEAQIVAEYELPWSSVRGHRSITEGERTYHIVYLAAPLVGELFAGFSAQSTLKRKVWLSAPSQLRMFGHNLRSLAQFSVETEVDTGESQSAKETTPSDQSDKKQPEVTTLHWEAVDKTDPFPLFFGFGSWEKSKNFELKMGADRGKTIKGQLVTPLGSRFHQLDGMNLRRLQLKRIKAHASALSMISLPSPESSEDPLLFVTLPDHPNYFPPDLRSSGVIFINEAWFYRERRFGYALPIRDRLKLYEHLYVAAGGSVNGDRRDEQLVSSLGRWSATHHLYSPPSGWKRDDALEAAHIDLTKRLISLAASESRPLQQRSLESFSELMNACFNMITMWLKHSGQGTLEEIESKLGRLIREGSGDLRGSTDQVLREVGRQLTRLDSRIKPIFESFLSNKGLPLIQVKWQQRENAGKYDVRFTLSQRPFVPSGFKRLQPAMWIVPVCLKLGIKDNPVKVHCILLDQPERSDYEITLDAPLQWVHPNAGQSGLYLWSLQDDAFARLLESTELTLSEQLSLTEMSASILETTRGSPKIYLRAVQQLALNPNHPLSLDQLFTHLNQVVLYFGAFTDEVGYVKQWASAMLQGVMMSNPRFKEKPLNYLTQLQLAQWDQGEVGMGLSSITKKEKRMLKRFLQPTSNQQAFEDDVAKVALDQIQYPLLLQAQSGDEKLWDKLYVKLAESDDQPLVRLLLIQGLVQFIDRGLFTKTLDLLKEVVVEEGDEERADREMAERDEVDEEEREEGEGMVADEASPELTEEVSEEEGEKEEEEAIVSLRAEDALELVRGIRSVRARRLAWSWLTSHKASIGELIDHGDRIDIQEAILAWSGALCDKEQLKELEAIFEGGKGFKRSALDRGQVYLRAARRCVAIRKLKSVADKWMKRFIEG